MVTAVDSIAEGEEQAEDRLGSFHSTNSVRNTAKSALQLQVCTFLDCSFKMSFPLLVSKWLNIVGEKK